MNKTCLGSLLCKRSNGSLNMISLNVFWNDISSTFFLKRYKENNINQIFKCQDRRFTYRCLQLFNVHRIMRTIGVNPVPAPSNTTFSKHVYRCTTNVPTESAIKIWSPVTRKKNKTSHFYLDLEEKLPKNNTYIYCIFQNGILRFRSPIDNESSLRVILPCS